MTEGALIEIERANHVRALERELSRVQVHAIKTASALIDVGAAIAPVTSGPSSNAEPGPNGPG